MNTPAAKRRRIEATKTLRKPFRSPLISRRGGDKEEAKTTGSEGEGEEGQSSKDAAATNNRTNTTTAAAASSVGAASSPSPLRTKVPRRSVNTRQPFKSPSVAVSSSSAAAAVEAKAKEPRPNPDTTTPDGTSKAGPSSQVAAGAAVRPSDEQLKRANGDAAGAAADGDDELRHLIAKWKAASRLAAEMVFDIAKQRVDSAGGPKAWRQQQKSWDEPASGTKGSDDGEGRELGGENYMYDHYGSSCDDNQRVSDDDYEPAFTIGTMLKTMNIDPAMLGYNEHEDAWID